MNPAEGAVMRGVLFVTIGLLMFSLMVFFTVVTILRNGGHL